MQERRVKEYPYPQCLEEGWYLADYDFDTQEHVLRPFDKNPLTATQARLLAYDDIRDVPIKHRRIIWPELYEGE